MRFGPLKLRLLLDWQEADRSVTSKSKGCLWPRSSPAAQGSCFVSSFRSHTHLLFCVRTPWTHCLPQCSVWHCLPSFWLWVITVPLALTQIWSKTLPWTSGLAISQFQTATCVPVLGTELRWAAWTTALAVLHSVFLVLLHFSCFWILP